MPVRTHAPECAKTLAVVDVERVIGRTCAFTSAVPCDCGAIYESGVRSVAEREEYEDDHRYDHHGEDT